MIHDPALRIVEHSINGQRRRLGVVLFVINSSYLYTYVSGTI